ncbi:MAG: hypothetical protein NPIRA03_06680 [Nitrospirales bacterium]|nr:MAG: hypothetical protein NPIRA03_06680 [Nitrospirales bacterium]
MKLETIPVAAEVLRCCKATLYAKIRSNEIPAYHIGRKVLVNIPEVLAALRNGTDEQ